MATFNLESAVGEWKKRLFKTPRLEESHVVELEEGLRDEIEDLVSEGMSKEEAFLAATAEKASPEMIGGEFHKVRTRRRSGHPFWAAPPSMPALLGHFLKIAWRRTRRHQGYAFLNIAGLALSVTCVLMILLYVRHETSYDRFHPDVERTFRVAAKSHIEGIGIATTSSLLAGAFEAEFPEVESTLRVRCLNRRFVRIGQRMFKETKVWLADAGIFDLLSVRLVAGNPQTALAGPNDIILSERTAKKYFGDVDPLRQTVIISDTAVSLDGATDRVYQITGVFRDMPSNTHLHADLIAPFPPPSTTSPAKWTSFDTLTYFKVKKETNREDLQVKVQALIDARTLEEREASMGKEKAASVSEKTRDKVFFQALTSIHLHSDLWDEPEPRGNVLYVAGFSVVAVLILIIGCVNFINLATARAGTCAREVGIRKVSGSSRSLLVRQFMTETGLITVLAFILALAAAGLCLPFFNGLTGLRLELNMLAQPGFLLSVLAILVLVSVLAGLYPAFVLSSPPSSAVLKGRIQRGSAGRGLRKALVVFQFTVIVVLMMGTLLVSKQLRYIRAKNPGFDKEQVLLIHDLFLLGGQSAAFKQEVLRWPEVLSISLTGNPPVRPDAAGILGGLRLDGAPDASRSADVNVFLVDEDYIPTMGMDIVRGRNFLRSMPTDSSAVIINEAAARLFGVENLMGRRFSVRLGAGGEITRDPTTFTIIGVVRDFNFKSLRDTIEPLVLFNMPRNLFAAIRLRTNNAAAALDFIRSAWNKFVPGLPLEYSFQDEGFEALHRADRTTGRILGNFTFLGILIGCLGLFGLAAFMAEQRTKEIGIRKVLGATAGAIAGLLIKEFVLLVAWANLIAAPIAFILMNKWLRGFAYTVNIDFGLFGAARAISLSVSLAAVLHQALRAAFVEPVKSLRYE